MWCVGVVCWCGVGVGVVMFCFVLLGFRQLPGDGFIRRQRWFDAQRYVVNDGETNGWP